MSKIKVRIESWNETTRHYDDIGYFTLDSMKPENDWMRGETVLNILVSPEEKKEVKHA